MRPLSLLFALLGALLALPSWAGPSELERKLEQQIAAFQAGSLSGEDLRRELIAEGSEVFPLVLEAAPSARGPVRGVLLRALLQLDRKRGEAALLELTRDRFLYAAALDALAEEGGPDLLEPLLELLDVESPARSKARLALIALARRTRTERRLVEALELRVRKAVELKAWSVGFNEALGLLLELERYRCVKVVRDCLQERPLRPAALNGLARLVPEDGELEGEGWENWRQLCAALEALLARPVELSGLEQCQVLNALRSVGTLSQLPALIRYGASDPSQSCRDLLEDALEDLSGLEQPTLDHWRAYRTKVEPIWERYPELLDQVSNQGEEQALAALGQLRYVRNRRTMAAIELRLSEPVGERLLLGFVELLVELALPRTNDLLDAIARNSGATPAVLKQVEWARGFFRDAPDPPPGERRMRALPRRRAQARSRPPQQILIAGEGLADSD
ncbi:MAG TPA: hypothetical protein DEA08_03845, partial [Planctomycetes bacterium]|nr:hypothetical protein [Planctomycetota bacterium]